MSSAHPVTARQKAASESCALERLSAQLSAAAATLGIPERLRLGDLALDKIRQGLCVFDGEQRLLLFNRRYAEMYNLRPEDLWVGMTLRDVVDLRYGAGTGPDMPREAYAEWRNQIAVADRVVETIVELRTGAVHEIHHEPTPGGGWVATFDDITERRRFEASIQHMAHHDALTGLANRALFTERLDRMVGWVQEQGRLGALLCLDLDRFKEVNDSLGHAAGDELLRCAAARMQACLSPGDLLARLGGDEFAIIPNEIGGREWVLTLASRLCDDLARPFILADGTVQVGVSVGIAFTFEAGEALSSEWMLRSADKALYRAKADNRSSYHVFGEAAAQACIAPESRATGAAAPPVPSPPPN